MVVTVQRTRAITPQPTRPGVGLVTRGLPRASLAAVTTTWEYATAPLISHATKQILDSWGTDGWELVTVVPGPNPGGLVAYFKRPKA